MSKKCHKTSIGGQALIEGILILCGNINRDQNLIGKGGARQLRRIVQEEVEGPLASLLLQSAKKPAAVNVAVGADGLEFSCSAK